VACVVVVAVVVVVVDAAVTATVVVEGSGVVGRNVGMGNGMSPRALIGLSARNWEFTSTGTPPTSIGTGTWASLSSATGLLLNSMDFCGIVSPDDDAVPNTGVLGKSEAAHATLTTKQPEKKIPLPSIRTIHNE